jgi:hypothetical protein
MPDEAKVWLRVRARQERGFYRLGRQWPVSESYAQVSEDEAKQLEDEPMLAVQRVSEGEVPQAQVQAENDKGTPQSKEQQRELLRNAEFPLLTASPGGQPVRAASPPTLPKTPPPEPQNSNIDATKKATEQPFENAGVTPPGSTPHASSEMLPPKEDEPPSESHFFGNSETSSKKKR